MIIDISIEAAVAPKSKYIIADKTLLFSFNPYIIIHYFISYVSIGKRENSYI